MRYKNGYHSGFTLIELLVVISIIGILSSVVLASVNAARGKASDSAIKMSANQMRTIYQMEYLSNGSYTGVSVLTFPISPAFGTGYTCSSSAGVYSCVLNQSAACTFFYGAGSEGEKICKDVLVKGSTSFTIGTLNSNKFVDTYAGFLSYPSNTGSGRCVGSSGNVTDQSSQANCFVSGVAW